MTRQRDLQPIVSGDDKPYSFKFRDQSGDPENITGWDVNLEIWEDDSRSTVVLSKTVSSHDDPTAGETTLELTSTDTSGVSGTKYYEFSVDTDAGKHRTVLRGHVPFVP